MGKWDFKIDGAMLHHMINNELVNQILERLVFDLKVFTAHVKRKGDIYHDFKDLLELVECDVIEQAEMEESEVAEIIDERLNELYDICDKWRVWITTH